MNMDIRELARKGLETELARVNEQRDRVLALLAGLNGQDVRAPGTSSARRARKMTDAGRQAIREAVQRRWAKVRAAASTGKTPLDSAGREVETSEASPADRQSAAAKRPKSANGRAASKRTTGNRKK